MYLLPGDTQFGKLVDDRRNGVAVAIVYIEANKFASPFARLYRDGIFPQKMVSQYIVRELAVGLIFLSGSDRLAFRQAKHVPLAVGNVQPGKLIQTLFKVLHGGASFCLGVPNNFGIKVLFALPASNIYNEYSKRDIWRRKMQREPL